jgi:hypothetical protein
MDPVTFDYLCNFVVDVSFMFINKAIIQSMYIVLKLHFFQAKFLFGKFAQFIPVLGVVFVFFFDLFKSLQQNAAGRSSRRI